MRQAGGRLLERDEGGCNSATVSIPRLGEGGHTWGCEDALQWGRQLSFGEDCHGETTQRIFGKPYPDSVLDVPPG